MANDSNFADPSDTHAELFLELNNGTKSNPYPSDLSVFNIPKKIKNKYDRIALISYEDQLALLDLNDENTLIITTDWLTWRLCSDRGAHCLHVESALAEWPDEWSDADRHYQKSNEWMYVDGEDITLFRGVSLGKQFYKEFAHISRTYLLLWNSLHRMCRTFQPCQIIYFDICTETDGLDSSLKLFIVESVAAHHEIKILNRSKEVRTENHQHPEIGFINQLTHRSNLKDVLRIFYETFVNFLFSLRIVSSDSKPRVYILLNWLALNGLLQNYNSQKVTPVILASQFPKTIKFFMSCWRRGIYLSKL